MFFVSLCLNDFRGPFPQDRRLLDNTPPAPSAPGEAPSSEQNEHAFAHYTCKIYM